jgi:hypothetical protein
MSGIIVLTQKGRDALKSMSPELNAVCRNILVQIDGKKSTDDILVMFRGLKGLDESIQKLLAGGYINISRECRDLVKSLAQQMLGLKAPTFLKKIDEMHAKYGDACWTHLEELDKTARLFYGEVIANNLKTGIEKIIRETKITA